MIWHFTVDGLSACTAPETCDDRLQPATSCSYDSLEHCQADAQRVRDLYPNADVKVHEGGCNAPRDDYDYGYQAGYAAGYEKGMSDAKDDACPPSKEK